MLGDGRPFADSARLTRDAVSPLNNDPKKARNAVDTLPMKSLSLKVCFRAEVARLGWQMSTNVLGRAGRCQFEEAMNPKVVVDAVWVRA